MEKTLQVKDSPSPRIFALGDVVDLPGPKMGRAATIQSFLVAGNVVRSIKGQRLKDYKPSMVDSSIELTLGLVSRCLMSTSRNCMLIVLFRLVLGKECHVHQRRDE